MEQTDAEWDYCTITYRTYINVGGGEHGGLNYGLLWFVAEAKGVNGRYIAHKSPETPFHRMAAAFPEKSNPSHVSLHQDFVQALLRDGWQPVSGGGAAWWQKRFRRQSRKAKPTVWQQLWHNFTQKIASK